MMVHVARFDSPIGGRPVWRQYQIVRDGQADILDLDSVKFGFEGWRVRQIWHQGAEDWHNMNADQIRAYIDGTLRRKGLALVN